MSKSFSYYESELEISNLGHVITISIENTDKVTLSLTHDETQELVKALTQYLEAVR